MAQAKKARQKISYVLENAKSSAGGHSLGINGLAVDPINSVLYSGGRDGIVCAWDVNFNSTNGSDANTAKPQSSLKSQCQAHMNWINDIALAQDYTSVVSASSDLSVKVWRPYSEEDNKRAVVIGEHADYIKCVKAGTAGANANIVASGGLDRKVCLWDLTGKGKILDIDVTGEETAEKGSVYSLALGRNIVASGGPEKTIRLHDPRSGTNVSKLMGHVANIRSILIDDSDDTILSASADKTIKLWSIRGGRCMYTFSMHDDSIWSLYSDDPKLGIFYSSDRSGLIAKTDIRVGLEDIDNGLSIAIAQEHCAVGKVVAANGHIWTATDRSSVNCWADVETGPDAQLPVAYRHQRNASLASNKSWRAATSPTGQNGHVTARKDIKPESILKMSNMAAFSRSGFDTENTTMTDSMVSRGPDADIEPQSLDIKPVHATPVETIEGRIGLLKHKLLNDRRRVLTLDTAGDVLLWDLLECRPIQSFGKQHLEDVEFSVNTREAVAPWCSIDVISGNLTVVLEPFNCFDGEVYADELELKEPVEFKDDQRISLGRWVLRYLFANVIDEEIKRDEAYREKINAEVEKKLAAAPSTISIPPPAFDNTDTMTTPRPGVAQAATTPGTAIGAITPNGTSVGNTTENSATATSSSGEKDDYFVTSIAPIEGAKPAAPASETVEGKTSTDGNEKAKDEKKDKEKDKTTEGAKSPSTPFGKKFRMSFSSKKLGRSPSMPTQEKPVIDEKAVESESSSNHEKEVDDSFYGVIQKIRNDYEKQLTDFPDKLVHTKVTPSLPSDTPVLKIPSGTQIFIQEETSGGSSTIYQGTVAGVGRDIDIIEQKAPMWLGDVLLQNQIPMKDPVKISFVLHPLDGLPVVASEGNSRLNANRMLRVRKILSYVAERIEPPAGPDDVKMEAEEYLELYCNDQKLSPKMSLATLRTHIWKGGNDIVLYYKTNGRKELRPLPPPTTQQPEPAATADANASNNSSDPSTPGTGATPSVPATPQTTS